MGNKDVALGLGEGRLGMKDSNDTKVPVWILPVRSRARGMGQNHQNHLGAGEGCLRLTLSSSSGTLLSCWLC